MKQNYPTHTEIEIIVSYIIDAKMYAEREYWECSKESMEKAKEIINNFIMSNTTPIETNSGVF